MLYCGGPPATISVCMWGFWLFEADHCSCKNQGVSNQRFFSIWACLESRKVPITWFALQDVMAVWKIYRFALRASSLISMSAVLFMIVNGMKNVEAASTDEHLTQLQYSLLFFLYNSEGLSSEVEFCWRSWSNLSCLFCSVFGFMWKWKCRALEIPLKSGEAKTHLLH